MVDVEIISFIFVMHLSFLHLVKGSTDVAYFLKKSYNIKNCLLICLIFKGKDASIMGYEIKFPMILELVNLLKILRKLLNGLF